jgi:hypothetical protein
MPHAVRTEILRPFRHEDGLATLRAKIAQARLDGFPDAGSELHGAFSSVASRFMVFAFPPSSRHWPEYLEWLLSKAVPLT